MTAITVGMTLTQPSFSASKEAEILSHNTIDDSEELVAERVASITQRLQSVDPATLALPLNDTLALLDEMAKCPGLGRWLLMHQGLNGFWTAESILRYGGSSSRAFGRCLASDAPVFRATRERFGIFKQALQKRLDAGDTRFVSVPCGTMEDLLTLPVDSHSKVHFIGVDLDPLAAKWIQQIESLYPASVTCTKQVIHGDAFSLPTLVQDAEVLVSNGLNIYIRDDEEVVKLYKSFAAALKVGGTLITSHLAPPAMAKPYSADAQKRQLAIVRDICEMRWQVFRTPEVVIEHLKTAGFEVHEVVWDSQKMFPTYIATKVK